MVFFLLYFLNMEMEELVLGINTKQPDDAMAITPLELADIFYNEAKRIAKNDAEAEEMTSDAVESFIAHYKVSPLSSLAIKSFKSGNC